MAKIAHGIVASMSPLFPRLAVGAAIMAIGSGCGTVVRSPPDGDGTTQDQPSDAGIGSSDAPIAPPVAVTLTDGSDAKKVGSGDTPMTDVCSSSRALIAFSGGLSDLDTDFVVVGSLRGACATVGVGAATAEGYVAAPGSTSELPQRGNVNDAPWSLVCPASQFVVGVAVRTGDGMDQFQLQCAPLSLIRSGDTWVGQTGTVTLGADTVGGDGGSPDSALCPAGQVATGYETELWEGQEVASIALKCSVVVGQ